jgi:hypothetical protein
MSEGATYFCYFPVDQVELNELNSRKAESDVKRSSGIYDEMNEDNIADNYDEIEFTSNVYDLPVEGEEGAAGGEENEGKQERTCQDSANMNTYLELVDVVDDEDIEGAAGVEKNEMKQGHTFKNTACVNPYLELNHIIDDEDEANIENDV